MARTAVNIEEKRLGRWYFGGLASSGAAMFTHPLDLLKVTLQTQQDGKLTLLGVTKKVIREQGFFALYNGISASLCRQMTYSLTRFGVYEVGKQSMPSDVGFASKVALAAVAGAAGGFVGTPADMINVRMQNDVKLPKEKRRNYKNVFHGFTEVMKTSGPLALWSGATLATLRATVVTVGQIACYDHFKYCLMTMANFKDNATTHLAASTMSGIVACTITQPVDVLKTNAMNSHHKSIWKLIQHTGRTGPLGFFKGYVPAATRMAPHNIITFLILERLRLSFGHLVIE